MDSALSVVRHSVSECTVLLTSLKSRLQSSNISTGRACKLEDPALESDVVGTYHWLESLERRGQFREDHVLPYSEF